MTVLVTRPQEQGTALCQRLRETGIPAIHHPLIDTAAGAELPLLLTALPTADIIIAVSRNSTLYSDEFLTDRGIKWPEKARYLAVGQKSAHLLSKVCQQKVNYPEISDSEHLLALSPLQDVKDKQVVILRGNGGRELIFETLAQRGAQVRYIEVYQRKNRPFNAGNLVPEWQQAGVDRLVVTSSSQLAFLLSQLDEPMRNWLFTLHLFVPSARIEQEARTLGFHQVTNTVSAANEDLAAALQPKQTGL